MRRDIFGFGLAIAAQFVFPQAAEVDTSGQDFRLSVTAELVLLDVSVTSAAGGHVSGLTRKDFTVYEDGKVQTVCHFATEDVPVTAGLVIDASASMQTKRPEVVAAALAFIGASNRRDELFVVHFSDRVSLGLPSAIPFTSDLAQLQSALWKGVPQGRTALNDAVIFSLRHLEQGRQQRRALVLVSDGGDNNSVHATSEVLRVVLESRVTIYTIGIFDAADQEKRPELLRRLARISGGESFWEVPLSAVNGICRQIASDIRARYTIGYVPVRSGEQGASRTIKVTASAPGRHKVIVRTRTAYVLPPKRPLVDRDGEPSRKRGL